MDGMEGLDGGNRKSRRIIRLKAKLINLFGYRTRTTAVLPSEIA